MKNLAWDGGMDRDFASGEKETIHLLCGCMDHDSQIVETYTVQEQDTLFRFYFLLKMEDWKA